MKRIILAVVLSISVVACTHVAQQPLTVNEPRPQAAELQPIEAMALFREAVVSEDWQAVRSALAEDDESAQQSIRMYKNEKNGHWLIVPVAETVRGDVAVVIVSYRTRNVPSLPGIVCVGMVKVGGKWMIVDSDRSHWRVPTEQSDRVYSLAMNQGAQLAAFYMGGTIGGDSYVNQN
jgi:hypothetical protein